MTFKELQNTIHSWIVTYASPGSECILSNGNAPRPQLPYITYQLRLTNKPGSGAYYSPGDADGNQTISFDKIYNLSLQAYGDANGDACELLETIQEAILLPEKYNALKANNVSIMDEGTLTDISELVDVTIEDRWLLELTVGIKQTLTHTPSIIENVNISGDIDGRDVPVEVTS